LKGKKNNIFSVRVVGCGGITIPIPKTWMADQEVNFAPVTYWEGAVHSNGNCNGVAVQGNGYIELTGYVGNCRCHKMPWESDHVCKLFSHSKNRYSNFLRENPHFAGL